jgi:hypothetical protein
MKRFLGWLCVIIIILGVAYYFTPSKIWRLIPGNVLAQPATKNIVTRENKSGSGTFNLKSFIPAPLANFTTHPIDTIQTDLNSTLNYAQNTVKNQVAKVFDFIASSPSRSTTTTTSTQLPADTTVKVCSLVKIGDQVSFQITSPLSSSAKFNYTITWGDGTIAKGATSNELHSTISHPYGKIGNYTITFLIQDTEGDFTTERNICVK